jgi:transposase-like protein
MSVLSKPYFHNEEAAFEHLESVLWPVAPICPHCGSINAKHYDLRKTRIGLRKCCEKPCRKQFTVRVGTVFESAHIPLHKTLQAVYLMCASKKGVSAHQIHRILGVTYKTAWFLCHRIREALGLASLLRGAARARSSRLTRPTSAANPALRLSRVLPISTRF